MALTAARNSLDFFENRFTNGINRGGTRAGTGTRPYPMSLVFPYAGRRGMVDYDP